MGGQFPPECWGVASRCLGGSNGSKLRSKRRIAWRGCWRSRLRLMFGWYVPANGPPLCVLGVLSFMAILI